MSVSANSAAASRPRSSDAARQSRTSNFKVTSRPKPPQTHNSSEWVHLNADPLLTSPTSAHFQTTSPTELEDVPTARSGISLSLSSPNTSALRPQEDDISGSEFAGVIDTDRISVRYDAQGRRMVNQ